MDHDLLQQSKWVAFDTCPRTWDSGKSEVFERSHLAVTETHDFITVIAD
jgi:hypothetical protein